jgi:two-component system cell cycle sensor histidine kinase/response regulator CckA
MMTIRKTHRQLRPKPLASLRLLALLVLLATGLASARGEAEWAFIALVLTGVAALAAMALGLIGPRPASARRAQTFPILLDALPAGYAIGDQQGRILEANGRFLKLAGLSHAPKRVQDIAVNSKDAPAAIYRLLNAAAKGERASEIAGAMRLRAHPLPYENVLGAKGRLIIWENSKELPAKDAERDRPQSLAVQLLLDALPLPAFIFDARGQVIASNRPFKRHAGIAEKDRAAGHVTAFLLREGGEPFLPVQWRHFLNAGGDKIVALRNASAPGIRFRAFFSAAPQDESVSTAFTLCVLAPAPSRPLAVADSGADLFTTAPIAMAAISADGLILEANPAFLDMFCEGSGGPGRALSGVVDAECREPLRNAIRDAGQANSPAGQPLSLEVKFGPDGKRRGQLFLSPGSRPQQLVVFGIDTTAQHALEEQVAHSQKMQAMGQLAGGIAHDFNNVLTAIIGFSDLLLARFRQSDPAFKDIMNIKHNANRAADLVRHLLAYSRRQTLRPRVLLLTDVIEDFNASLGRLLGEKVKARIVHGRDLWLVKADESQLFQVIMNLSVNARDAMAKGGLLTIRSANVTERESLDLKERGVERGEYVLWEVADTGTGISPEHLQRIFDPFFSTKDVGKGTGLGLSLVDGIIKQTGGYVLVDSKLGEGTTFRIYLPRHQEAGEDSEARPVSSKAQPEQAAADLTGSGTVLLVEDEDAVRSFASRALTTRGYKVLEASSGAEALEMMDRQQGAVDLVVSDVVMPEMDGPTLLSHLRKKKPDIRIVFMSGYAEEAFRKNLCEGEKFVFLPKPFTLKRLAETIKEATAA